MNLTEKSLYYLTFKLYVNYTNSMENIVAGHDLKSNHSNTHFQIYAQTHKQSINPFIVQVFLDIFQLKF